ncbi:MAG: segregation ATPase FtsK/SpoIIIE, family, partial [Acidobacteriota bacterium]|nr:segregation ATPase FtsK/SpoIIIE, family [Acidobacteriota bacterium]
MATTIQTETRTKMLPAKRGSRRNEIVVIALLAVGALLVLCLLFFHPNDTSLNAAGQTHTDNLIGPVGAYVSDALLQTFGLAAYLLPLLLFAAAVRRFQKKPLRAPLGRVIGLVVLLLSVAGLLALSSLPVFFDARVQAGGFVGALLASQLAGAAGRVGALILFTACGAVAVLLATNFSFARAYERGVEAFGSPQDFFRAQVARFNAWQAARRVAAAERAAEKQAARAERELLRADEKRLKNKTGADRVNEFMSEPLPSEQLSAGAAAIQRNAAAATKTDAARSSSTSNATARVLDAGTASSATTTAAGGAAMSAVSAPLQPSPARAESQSGDKSGAATAMKRTAATSPARDDFADDAEVEEMVRDVSVVRTEPGEEEAVRPRANDKAAREAKKLERAAAAMSDYKIPPVDFLNAAPPRHEQADEELRSLATRVAEKCKEFNVTGKIEYICPGPVVTTYEFKPDPGVKYSRVTGLVDDLCLALRAESIRIDRVPGKAHVGIEVPNAQRDNIMLREVVESRQFLDSPSKLTLALGKTIDGLNYVADLARMPHLLIAGATGTGKSVCLNSLVVSIIYKARPDEVKFIMIDPKRLELGLYADIPHLATPIIT